MAQYCPPGRVCVSPAPYYPNNGVVFPNNGFYNGPRPGGFYGPGGGVYYGGSTWFGPGNSVEGRDGWWWGRFENRYAFWIRIAHGVLASLAFVFFFPVGAILVRIIPGRFATWIHAAMQIFGWILFMIAAALAYWMLRNVQIPFRDMLNNAHAVIGIIVFALMIFQPFLGFLHHSAYRRTGQRSVWSHVHMWLGRIVITMGIVNGGLGIKWAQNSTGGAIAYGVVAGFIWIIWVLVAVASEILRFTRRGRRSEKNHRSTGMQMPPAVQSRMGHRSRGRSPSDERGSVTPPAVAATSHKEKRPVYS